MVREFVAQPYYIHVHVKNAIKFVKIEQGKVDSTVFTIGSLIII